MLVSRIYFERFNQKIRDEGDTTVEKGDLQSSVLSKAIGRRHRAVVLAASKAADGVEARLEQRPVEEAVLGVGLAGVYDIRQHSVVGLEARAALGAQGLGVLGLQAEDDVPDGGGRAQQEYLLREPGAQDEVELVEQRHDLVDRQRRDEPALAERVEQVLDGRALQRLHVDVRREQLGGPASHLAGEQAVLLGEAVVQLVHAGLAELVVGVDARAGGDEVGQDAADHGGDAEEQDVLRDGLDEREDGGHVPGGQRGLEHGPSALALAVPPGHPVVGRGLGVVGGVVVLGDGVVAAHEAAQEVGAILAELVDGEVLRGWGLRVDVGAITVVVHYGVHQPFEVDVGDGHAHAGRSRLNSMALRRSRWCFLHPCTAARALRYKLRRRWDGMETVFLASALCVVCPPGEYELAPCTETSPTLCWPCNPGFSCKNNTQRACGVGLWSGSGSAWCEPCGGCAPGQLLAAECGRTSDTVCTPCPKGYGCDGSKAVAECPRGWFSLEGACMRCPVNYTTSSRGSGWLGDCFCESPHQYGCDGCAVGSWFIVDSCRACPAGYECNGSQLRQCAVDTYSQNGACVPCVAFSHTRSVGASSELECVCDRGWVKIAGGVCAPCAAGTVFVEGGRCAACPAGEYCLGKAHHESCPADMFAAQGAAMCRQCRPDSECEGGKSLCVDADNCTCVDGFIDVRGECRRCGAGTQSDISACSPCAPGYECLGGPEVRECAIGTYSPGNRSQCLPCTDCPELTTARCNRTHDSACQAATYPFAIITIHQRYTTEAPGDMFRVFAMVYASAIPRSQVMRFCDATRCVDCFQGVCPERTRTLYPPVYELVVEVRSEVGRLSSNIEMLTQGEYLQQTAAVSMAKVTDTHFALVSNVEHTVICPEGATWDGQNCVAPTSRSWMGLCMASVLLVTLGACGYRRQKEKWLRISQVALKEPAAT